MATCHYHSGGLTDQRLPTLYNPDKMGILSRRHAATTLTAIPAMKIAHHESIDQQPVNMPGSSNCRVRWLIGASDGAPNFAMRQFEVAPGGYTPRHSHPYEHEVFVLAGEGTIAEGSLTHTIRAGDIIYVAPDEIHQFSNTSDQPLKFLCLVPNDAMSKPVTQQPECGVEPA